VDLVDAIRVLIQIGREEAHKLTPDAEEALIAV